MNNPTAKWNAEKEEEFNSQVSITGSYKSFFLKKWSKGSRKTLILAFHDIGGYHESFQDFSKYILDKTENIDVIAIDMLGHGLSSGNRGHIESMNELIFDYLNVLEKIDFTQYEKIFFLGQGAGGLLSLELYTHFENKLKIPIHGLIISNFILNFNNVFLKFTPWSSLKYILNHTKLYKLYDSKDLTSDVKKISRIESDPLIVHGATLQTFKIFMKKSQSVYQDSYFLDVPVMSLISENNPKIYTNGIDYFHKGLKKGLLTKKVYANFKHDLYNEKESVIVYEDILNWIKEHE